MLRFFQHPWYCNGNHDRTCTACEEGVTYHNREQHLYKRRVQGSISERLGSAELRYMKFTNNRGNKTGWYTNTTVYRQTGSNRALNREFLLAGLCTAQLNTNITKHP